MHFDWEDNPDSWGKTKAVPALLADCESGDLRNRTRAFERLAFRTVVLNGDLSPASVGVTQWLIDFDPLRSIGCETWIADLLDSVSMGLLQSVSTLVDPTESHEKARQSIRGLLAERIDKVEAWIRIDRDPTSSAWLELLAEAVWNLQVQNVAVWACTESRSPLLRLRSLILVNTRSNDVDIRGQIVKAAQASEVPVLRYYGFLFGQLLPEGSDVEGLISSYCKLAEEDQIGEPYYQLLGLLPALDRALALDLVTHWPYARLLLPENARREWIQAATRIIFDDHRSGWPDVCTVDKGDPQRAYTGISDTPKPKSLAELTPAEIAALLAVLPDVTVWQSMAGLWSAFGLPLDYEEAVSAIKGRSTNP